MKNLFKKLMLVAVAAMAFTACSQDVNEVNKVEKVTRYEFTANIADDTRSGFAEKEEGATAYKSEWYGNETLKIFVTDYNGYNVETTATVDEDGNFTLKLTDAPESFFMTVVSPADSWVSENTANIPAEQTSGVNSVDPKAHLLQAQAVHVSGGVADINMTHMAAYGKMTVNGVDFAIDHVVVDLKGSYYSYDREYSYTINATNVVNNTFWFATEPIDVAEFTVTAYDAEGKAVTKTVNVAEAGKTMSFNYGRVGTFSVSGLEAAAEPSAPMFTSAYVYDYGSGYSDYYLIFEDAVLGELVLNPYYLTNNDWTISAGVYGFAGAAGYFYTGQYSTYNDIYLYGGTVEVAVVDGEYVFTFSNLKNGDGNIVLEKATYTGIPDGLAVPDMRTALAKPNVTATAQGNIVTLSWDAVTGADEYYVFCASTDSISPITTTETTVTIEAAYNTTYQFMVTAVASDTNPDFKSSEATYVDVLTEKDPNGPIAEYMATELKWDSAGYFVFVTDHYEIFRVKMNDADCPNHTTILKGNYTAVASSSVPAGKFSVYQKVVGGYSEGWSSTKTTSTMSVSYVDGEYVIIVNYISAWGGSGEVGYKGVPEDWVVPTGGSGDSGDEGDEGDEPVTPSGPGTGTESDPYRLELSNMTSSSYVAYNFNVPGDGNKELHVETNWTNGTQEGSFTFAGDSAPIVAYWSKYDGQTVSQGGAVNITKKGSNWRIDMCVLAPQGTFYAYYEGPLTR